MGRYLPYLASCGDGSVGSVSCWPLLLPCQLPEPDYLYRCYGWIFGEFCRQRWFLCVALEKLTQSQPWPSRMFQMKSWFEVLVWKCDLTYPMDKEPMLKDVSFTIEPGKMVGVVGFTGAGNQPWLTWFHVSLTRRGGYQNRGKGYREVGGRDPCVSCLYRSPTCYFSGTIADNFWRWGARDATLFEMERAAIIAQASEFIHRMEKPLSAQLRNEEPTLWWTKTKGWRDCAWDCQQSAYSDFWRFDLSLGCQVRALAQEALNKELKATNHHRAKD